MSLKNRALISFLLAGIFATAAPAMTPPVAAAADPPRGWHRLDTIVRDAIAARQLPGAVLIVGHRGKIVYRKAYGYRALRPRREKMTLSTIFDCASLTKVVATAPVIMRLLEQGRIRLNDPVAMYLPPFGVNGKSQITIRELLTHTSGLEPDLSLRSGWTGYRNGIRRAEALQPEFPPGSRFQYSDVNFIMLGELAQHLTHLPLDEYAESRIWRPIGMRHTRFLPSRSWWKNIAPTEPNPNRRFRSLSYSSSWLRGIVHDPVTRAMGGITGAAGMFSTAGDLARFAQMMLNLGVACPGGKAIPCRGGRRIFSPVTVAKMTTPQTPYNLPVVQGLGWDLDSPFSTNRGELLPVGSYGHTGFTGTSLWIDPYTQTYIVLLANSVHPFGRPPIISLRSKIATAVAALVTRDWGPARRRQLTQGVLRITGYNSVNYAVHRPLLRQGRVRTGLDVLEKDHFAPLRGLRVGLITNETGLDRKGRRNLDVMLAAGIDVVCGFSPEHGWVGKLDSTNISNTRDAKTGIPVFTAYGATPAQRHLPEAGLKLVNALVYDIQDGGERFYTFETTLGYSLEAAAAHHIPIFVLDRPNPINGVNVQGPALAADERSFIGFFPGMPVRNGMTIGELAEMFNAQDHIGADLRVIRMQGWQRGDYYDETGLTWVNPSPNLRNLEQEILYPGVALIEYTNVSVGRGTDTPFQWFGAPWIRQRQLARYLNARRIPGVEFMPVSFTPDSSKYAHQLCQGVLLELMDRYALDPVEMGVEIASALAHLYPQHWKAMPMHPEIGSRAIVRQILRGEDPRRIQASWQGARKRFLAIRAKYLLYR